MIKQVLTSTAFLLLLMGCEEEAKKKVEADGTVITEVNEPKEEKKEKVKPATKSIEGTTDDARPIIAYHWHNIESMEKADTILEAVETIYGSDRYYYDNTEKRIELMGNMFDENNDKTLFGYQLNGKSEVVDFSNNFTFNLVIDNSVDMRMEMIDFLHYLKESGLIISESNFNNLQIRDYSNFTYLINLYDERLPGENYSKASISWGIRAETLHEMDFSNKEGIYRKIFNFGKYEGPYPSVDEQHQE